MTSKLKTLSCILCLFISTAILHAQDSGWEMNPHDYQYDMTVYAKLVVDDNVVADFSNYEIAAFVGDECRGIAEVKTQAGYTWLYLRIRSNTASGETVNFKIFDKTANKAFKAAENVKFESNESTGLPSEPFTVTMKRYTLGDVNDDGELNISDVQDLINIILLNDTIEPNPAYDFNEDGDINISDVQALINHILLS